MKIAIVALYFEMLDLVLNNIDKLNDITISGILFEDKQKYFQYKERYTISYDIFYNFIDILQKGLIDEVWIFSDKTKETDIEKKYIEDIIRLCSENKKEYKYIVPNNTLVREQNSNKITILFYHDIMNHSYIDIELYYRKMLNDFGLSVKIINMPNKINSIFNIYDYPMSNKSNKIDMEKLREHVLKSSEEIYLLDIPYDLSSGFSWKNYFPLYACLSHIFTSDYSIICLNAETYTKDQIDTLIHMSETFFGGIDDYFISFYGRKNRKSYKNEPERIIKYNEYEIRNNVNCLKEFIEKISFMNLEGYTESFDRFRNKIDVSIRPYTVVV